MDGPSVSSSVFAMFNAVSPTHSDDALSLHHWPWQQLIFSCEEHDCKKVVPNLAKVFDTNNLKQDENKDPEADKVTT